jgi:glutaredoxin
MLNVVVLSVPDCPNVGRMLDLLRQATAGRNDVTIESRVVDISQVMPAGFSGSPTVLIDGENRSGARSITEPACTTILPSLVEVTDWIR